MNMGFCLTSKSKKYLKKINENSKTGKFETMWDFYYLCLMAGFKNSKLGEETNNEEFNKDFPSQYEPNKYQLIAALVSSEIRRNGIFEPKSEDIKNIMLELIDNDNSTKLSKEGLELMNGYAEGGFELIYEKIPEPTDKMEFIKEYYNEFVKQ